MRCLMPRHLGHDVSEELLVGLRPQDLNESRLHGVVIGDMAQKLMILFSTLDRIKVLLDFCNLCEPDDRTQ